MSDVEHNDQMSCYIATFMGDATYVIKHTSV